MCAEAPRPASPGGCPEDCGCRRARAWIHAYICGPDPEQSTRRRVRSWWSRTTEVRRAQRRERRGQEVT